MPPSSLSSSPSPTLPADDTVVAPVARRSASDVRRRVESLRLQSGVQAGPRASARLLWAMCLALGAVCVFLAYVAFMPREKGNLFALDKQPGKAASSNSKDTDAAQPKSQPPEALGENEDVVLETSGYVTVTRQILVSPQVSGRLTKVDIEEGQRVEAGSVLAEIERTEYQADVKRAEAGLARAKKVWEELDNGSRPEETAQAKAELAEAEAQLKQARKAFERNQTLLTRRVISPEELETAESIYLALLRRIDRLKLAVKLLEDGPRQERIEVAAAEVLQAEADLIKARWRLDNCTVRSPITGTILKKNAEQGNIVNPIAHQGSYSLCEMADLSDLEVDLKVQERDISRVFPGQPCLVRANAYRDRVYRGVVSRLMPIADRAQAAVPVRVKIDIPADEEGLYLKPDMGAVVSFYKQGAKLPPTIGSQAIAGEKSPQRGTPAPGAEKSPSTKRG
jgi:multidrug resistance efflux pump